eukprot:1496379-Rhodomonas_salina.2
MPGSGARSSVGVQYSVTPQSMLAAAFEVPPDRVATLDVEVQLTAREACMAPAELQAQLRATLDACLSGAASEYKTVQVARLAVDKADGLCSRRRGAGLG